MVSRKARKLKQSEIFQGIHKFLVHYYANVTSWDGEWITFCVSCLGIFMWSCYWCCIMSFVHAGKKVSSSSCNKRVNIVKQFLHTLLKISINDCWLLISYRTWTGVSCVCLTHPSKQSFFNREKAASPE